jgi:glycosyltransferase involved in cell wall biosynthesis
MAKLRMTPSSQRLVAHVPRRFTENAWGGTERVLEQTLPLLKDYGFSSTIYTTQALDKALIGQVANVPVTRFQYFYPEWPLSPERKLRYDNKGGNLMSPSLANSLREIDELALVHCHTGNLLGAHCLRVAQARNVPTLLTLHGGHFAIPQVELESLAYRGKSDPRPGLRWGRLLSLALGTRQLLRKVDALICVGIDEYEAAKVALPDQEVYFLPGGVNLEEFARADRVHGRQLLGIDPKS